MIIFVQKCLAPNIRYASGALIFFYYDIEPSLCKVPTSVQS